MEVPFQAMVRKVGSLLTPERSVWPVSDVEVLANGELRVVGTGNGWAYEGVKLQAQDGASWLVATGRPQLTAPPVPNPEFLLSLIHSVTHPIQWDRPDESVSATAAYKWCTQYGLPVVEAVDPADGRRPKLSLSFFQRETLTLALLSRVWVALIYRNKDELAHYPPQLWKACASQCRGAPDYRRAAMIEEAALIATYSPTEREESAKRCIKTLLDERLGRVKLTFAWGDPTPRLHLEAGSLFDIAYVQMASLLTKPDDESTDYRMQHIKVCNNCGDLISGHGNRRHCLRPHCDRRAEHRRKMAQRKAASARPKQAKSL